MAGDLSAHKDMDKTSPAQILGSDDLFVCLMQDSAISMATRTPTTHESLNETESADVIQMSNIEQKLDLSAQPTHVEDGNPDSSLPGNLVYVQEDEEPEIHIRTWVAYGSMLLLIYCQNMCLQGPPSVVSTN